MVAVCIPHLHMGSNCTHNACSSVHILLECTGLLLALRLVLLLVFAVNDLLAISAATFGLFWLLSRVYKNWYIGVLNASYIFNLGILAVVTTQTRFMEIRLLLRYLNWHSICNLLCDCSQPYLLSDRGMSFLEENLLY